MTITASRPGDPSRDSADASRPANQQRRRWMAILARASREELEHAWAALSEQPARQWLRRPETGLAMLRGRSGGSGGQFNLGEASVTRCTLRNARGSTGVAYILGRDHRRAELAAQFDALLQEEGASLDIAPGCANGVIVALAAAQAARREASGRKTAATRVDFYTLVRGDEA